MAKPSKGKSTVGHSGQDLDDLSHTGGSGFAKTHENSHPLDVKSNLLLHALKTGKKCVLREELGSIVVSVYICLVLYILLKDKVC